MRERLSEVLAPFRGQKGATIPVLQKVQAEFGYLPEEAFPEIAKILGQSINEIFGVATFYAQFKLARPGKHTVKVCEGTACYVQAGKLVLEAVEDELKLNGGKITTDDYKFSIERVACFGSCALAPVMVIDNTVYGSMTPVKARQLLAPY